MKRAKVLEELRKMRFEEVYQLRTEKRLRLAETATILEFFMSNYRIFG